MTRVKVIGAGSIGNHLANAARTLGWSVDMVDTDAAALERTKTEIYPARYNEWDDAIRLFTPDHAPAESYDFAFIGTPPDSHMSVTMDALSLNTRPRAVLVEKPVCTPDLAGAQALVDRAEELGVACFVGYDHVVGRACRLADELVAAGTHGTIQTLDVEIREHWGGIFAAHPWLDGPQDSYLGFSRRGGGACGEHSHGINLWQHFAHTANAGRITEVSATMDSVRDGIVDYDRLCLLNLRTETGLAGRVVQDVVTAPPCKRARVQGDRGYVEWLCNVRAGADAVKWSRDNAPEEATYIEKTRADDFIEELRHMEAALESDASGSPIALRFGMETMLVIAAAYRSTVSGRTIHIDYDQGYTEKALKD